MYRARDRRLGREVAIKIIHRHLRENPEVRQRFASEARAVAKLKHPNIVEVYDVSDADEPENYLVVELVSGATLRQLLARQGPLPAEVAAAVAIEISGALDHAHQAGVIHRDVKPENVLVADPTVPQPDTQLEPVEIKITDFGIAKLLDVQGVTSTGQVLGSPAHMAPEQIEGGEVTPAADVFGLGVLLYECMVGQLPFDGKNPAQVLRRVLDGAFTPADRAQPTIGATYAAILSRALAHESKERFSSAREFSVALQEELSVLGFESSRVELHAFLRDSAGYQQAHEPRVIEGLLRKASAARTQRDYALAAACYNRALAYRPRDPELLRSVSTIRRGEQLRRVGRYAAVGLLGSIGVGVAAASIARSSNLRSAPPSPSVASSVSPSQPEIPSPPGPEVVSPASTAPAAPKTRLEPAPKPVRVVAPPVPQVAEEEVGVARLRVVVLGPQNAKVRIDGVETPWFGKVHETTPGTHVFEFIAPDERCCISGGPDQRILPASEGPDDVTIIQGRIEWRPAILELSGPPGATVSCGVYGQFEVPSVNNVQLPDGPKRTRCQFFPPEGTEPPKPFDVTLNPGETSAPLRQ